MSKMQKAVELLQAALPELTVRILPPETVGVHADAKAKLAIELPQSHADLRVTLMRKLQKAIGIPFHSDSRALNGACIDERVNRNQLLETVSAAVTGGKLSGFSLAQLEQDSTSQEKAQTQRLRAGGGRTAEAFKMLSDAVEATDRTGWKR